MTKYLTHNSNKHSTGSPKETKVKSAIRPRVWLGAAVVASIATLGLSVGQTSAEVAEDESIWTEIDAGSFGVVPANQPIDAACLFDAGSFGIENPIAACAAHSEAGRR